MAEIAVSERLESGKRVSSPATSMGAMEVAFRSVNDRIRELGLSWAGDCDFVCECEDRGCIHRVALSTAAYDKLRALPRRFLVVPGHEQPARDEVVTRGSGFLVVLRPEPAERLDD